MAAEPPRAIPDGVRRCAEVHPERTKPSVPGDSMIAAHGGKILAALFYLRAFIEQFARRVLGETNRRYGEN